MSISGWLTPYSFKSSIKSNWFNLVFPLPKLYISCFILRNTSVNGRRDTTNSNGDNESSWKIPQVFFFVPRSVLLQIKFVFQFFSFFQQIYNIPSSSHQFKWFYHPWMGCHVISFLKSIQAMFTLVFLLLQFLMLYL